MKANPGGELAPEEVVGRDRLIGEVWRVLERQSLILQAERRMGKSCVIKKMAARPRPGFLAVYRDLEGIKEPGEFAEVVARDVSAFLSRARKAADRARGLARKLRGVELGRIKFPQEPQQDWKDILTATFADLASRRQEKLVLFWDEVPYMLQGMGGGDRAREVLDTLRSLRQSLPRLRLVFTGSIGLHHVLSSLGGGGVTQAPTNDMFLLHVPPLEREEACRLAFLLLEGERVGAANREALAERIARAVDCVPFYIHHLVDRLARRGARVGVEAVEEVIDECLADPLDPWHMGHYRSRLKSYYGEREGLALHLLDHLALTPRGDTLDNLHNLVQVAGPRVSLEQVRSMLADLERDHYLQRREKRWHFLFSLVRYWWCGSRGL